jgi:hypothetical protein
MGYKAFLGKGPMVIPNLIEGIEVVHQQPLSLLQVHERRLSAEAPFRITPRHFFPSGNI